MHCLPMLESYARLAMRGLGQRLEQGTEVKPGQTYDFGGMMFSLAEEPGGIVLSRPVTPDGTAFLGEGTDVSDMLGVVALQVSLAKTLGVEPVPYTLFDEVLIEQGMHEEANGYLHRRAPASPEDSGWFIAKQDYEPGRPLQSVQVLQLFRVRRALLWALALPTDSLAFFEGDQLVRVVDPTNKEHDLRSGG